MHATRILLIASLLAAAGVAQAAPLQVSGPASRISSRDGYTERISSRDGYVERISSRDGYVEHNGPRDVFTDGA